MILLACSIAILMIGVAIAAACMWLPRDKAESQNEPAAKASQETRRAQAEVEGEPAERLDPTSGAGSQTTETLGNQDSGSYIAEDKGWFYYSGGQAIYKTSDMHESGEKLCDAD